MKKRILAMLLAVCMVVLAVPVFVLPTIAAEEPAYSTSFNSTTNLPTVSNGSVTWNGNWKFVNYGKVWDGSRDFVPGEDNPYSDTWAGPVGHVNWDGALTCGGKFGFMNYGSTNEEKFGPLGAMGGQTCTCPGTHPEKYNATGYPTLVYTAEKTGVIDIYFDKLGNAAELTEGEFTYLVYVNNELIATYNLTKVAGEEEWIYETKTLVEGDLEIERGQQVLFMVKCPLGDTNAALNGGNVLFPTIEYTSTNETFYTAFSQNMPTLSGSAPVFHGNWSFVGYTPGAANYANYTNVNRPSGWAGQLNGFTALATTTKGTAGGFYNVSAVQANYQGTGGGTLGSNTSESIAIRYVSEKSGVANISLEKLGNEANLAAGTNSFYIYVNGTKVWPLNGEANSVTGKGMLITQETKVVEGIALNLGDTIDFICENTAGRNMWGNGGSLIWGIVEFTQINDNVKVFNEENNLPTYNADGTVTWNGNFYGVGYVKGENGFTYDDPDSAILMTKSNALWSAGTGLTAKDGPTADLPWNNCASLILTNYNANYFMKGWVAVTGKMSGGIRYVAEETGTVKIDLAALGNMGKLTGGVEKFNYYVYVNGTKIWSSADSVTWAESNGTVTKYQTVTDIPVHAGIDVDYGDTIDFIVEGIGLADADLWLGSGNVVAPRITWTKIIPKPETSVNVAMGSSFALNAKVELPIGVLTEVDTVGFLVNGEEVNMLQTDVNKYTVNNVLKAYVQDLASDEVTIQAYYTTYSGKTIYGTEITTNIIEVIQAYVNGTDKAAADLAKATLNYIAQAQLYFDPTLSADDLANAILADEDMLDISVLDFNRYDDTVLIENEDATVAIDSVSMILNSATALKFYFELPEGADVEDYAFIALDPITMQQGLPSTGMLPAGAMAAPLQYTENGKAIAYFGSTFENMDRLYAFGVIDVATGEIASDLLIYSPLAYAATMAEDLEVGFVCASLVALNDAIDVYTGAVATR